MSVRLTVKQRTAAGTPPTELVFHEETITLGRDKSCQLVLAEPGVSRAHARITQEGTLCFLEDLGSSYGTQVNGKALPKGEKRLMRNGDVIAIAHFDVTFNRMAELSGEDSEDRTSYVARQVVKDAMRGFVSQDGPYFRFMNGPREGERIAIGDAQELIIGRDASAHIALYDDLVSRRHAKVRRDWAGTHVEDLGSRNGIRVNRKRVERRTLKDRDELLVGNVILLYVDPSEAPEAQVLLREPEAELSQTRAPVPEPAGLPADAPELTDTQAAPPDAAADPVEGEDEEEEVSGALAQSSPLAKTGRLASMVAMGLVGLVALILMVALLVGA